MKKVDKFFRTILSLLLVCSFFEVKGQTTKMNLKIMTYNVRHCVGEDNVLNLDRTASVITKFSPDVIALQELDSMCTRSGKVYQLSKLGDETGMYATFSAAISYGGGRYGVGILSKEKPISVKRIALPGAEARTFLICEFKNYVFACTHLALEEVNRLSSFNIILGEAVKWNKNFFIAGDWNDTPTSSLITEVKRSFILLNNTAMNTYPSVEPTECIDYLASYASSVIVKNSLVPPEVVTSDHRPSLVDIQFDVMLDGMKQIKRKMDKKKIYDLNGKFLGNTEEDLQRQNIGIIIVDRKKVLMK